MPTKILFLCPHNAAKSLIAAELFNQMARESGIDALADSAGSEPSEGVMPVVVSMLAADGIDVSAYTPRRYTDDDLKRWVMTLAAKEGIWPEASSVAPFAAIERLRADGTIASHERCVALLTASGLKDPGPIETALPEPPLVSGGLPELMTALKNTYGFAHG